MTDEQLRQRLESLNRELENLHHEIRADDQVEGEVPDFDTIGEDAIRCANAMMNIQANVACLRIDIPLRHLPIRGALRHLDDGE